MSKQRTLHMWKWPEHEAQSCYVDELSSYLTPLLLAPAAGDHRGAAKNLIWARMATACLKSASAPRARA
eukprot:668130-Pleurochrysis_carterae.AAC.1